MPVSWQEAVTPDFGGNALYDLLRVAPSKFCGVGGAAGMYSTDNALTWTLSTGLDARIWSGLACDGTTVVAFGDEKVATSSDFGQTWSINATGATAGVLWKGGCSPSSGVFIGVSDSGSNIIKSVDSGATWTQIDYSASLGMTDAWCGVASNADGSVIIALAPSFTSGNTMVSTDVGATWSAGTSPSDYSGGNYSGSNVIVYDSHLDGFATGGKDTSNDFATVWTTTDNASSWTKRGIDIGATGPTAGLVAAPAYGGFIASVPGPGSSTDSFIAYTADDGATWTWEDTTFSSVPAAWSPGAWDDDTGTVVFGKSFSFGGPDVALVGTFPLTPSGTFTPETGSVNGGTVITLTGTGLSGVVQGDVLIDGTAALSVHADPSGTSVTFITPPHAAGPVDIEVTGIGTFEDAYTYVGISGVSPSSGSTLGGQTVTIRGSGFNSATGVRFDTTPVEASNFTIVNNTTIRVVTPPHLAGVVSITVVGVETFADAYEYLLQLVQLPPIPYLTPIVPDRSRVRTPQERPAPPIVEQPWVKWFQAVKTSIETPPTIGPGQIVGSGTLDAVDDTNVTLTLTGTPESALLKDVTITAGWTGFLGPTRGGTGIGVVNAGMLLYGAASQRWAGLPVGAVDTFLKSTGTLPAWTAGEALTRVNDTNVTLTLTGDAATALVNAAGITVGWAGQLSLTRGGTNASLTAVNGGIVYSTASALAISAAGSSGQILRSAGAATPTWSTATYPATAATAGAYLRADGTNWITSTLTLPNAASTGDLPYATGSNALGMRTIGSTGDVLTVSGGVPVWSAAASVASAVTIANDTTTNATMFPTWVTANSGNLPLKVTSTKLTFNPSTGALSSPLGVFSTSVSTPSLITASGALGITPASGANVNVTLATTGDLAVNTDQLYVDTSAARTGVNTSAPASPFHVVLVQDNSVVRTEVARLERNAGSGAAAAGRSAELVFADRNNLTMLGSLAFERQNAGANFRGDFALYTNRNASAASALTSLTERIRINGETGAMTFTGTGSYTFTGSTGVTFSAGTMGINVVDVGVGTRTEVVRLARTGASVSSTERAVGLVFSDADNATLVGGLSGLRVNSASDYRGGLAFYVANDAGTGSNPVSAFSGLTEVGRIDRLGNYLIGTTTSPSTGSLGLVFGDGTALASMGSNTCGLYGDDVSGTVNLFGIAEDGIKTQLTSKIGYVTGAGGTVTQSTSKATAFTLSKVTGQITTANDSLAAATSVASTWTNTTIAATDVVVTNHVSGGTVGAYLFDVSCGAGSATLTITNRTAGSLSEALVISFVVLKGVTS